MSSEKEIFESRFGVDPETVPGKAITELQRRVENIKRKLKISIILATGIIVVGGGASAFFLRPDRLLKVSGAQKAINKRLKSKLVKHEERNEYLQGGIQLYEDCLEDITGIKTSGHSEGEEFVWYFATGPGTLRQMKKETDEEAEEETGGDLASFHNPGERPIK